VTTRLRRLMTSLRKPSVSSTYPVLHLVACRQHRTSHVCFCNKSTSILAAIKSFVPGLASGNDGLRPQHSKGLTSASAGEASQRLLCRLTEFTNLCLAGRVPIVVRPVFLWRSPMCPQQERRWDPSDHSRQHAASTDSKSCVYSNDIGLQGDK